MKNKAFKRILIFLLSALLALSPCSLAFAESGDEGTMHTMELGSSSDGQQTEEGRKDATDGLSEEELAQRKEIYTMVTLIALGAILVGLREKRGRR